MKEEVYEILKEYIGTRKIGNKLKITFWKNNYPVIYNKVITVKDENMNLSQFFYDLIYDTKNPLCKTCKTNKVSFFSFNKGYKTFCSKECANKDPELNKQIQKKLKHTILEKYGVDNISKLESIKEKKKKTMKRNYGVEYNFQRDDVKEILRINPTREEHKKAIENTLIEKYGSVEKYHEYFLKKRLETYKHNRDQKYIELGKIHGYNFIEFNKSNELLFATCNDCNNNFEINSQLFRLRKIRNEVICTNCNPINKNYSLEEKELLNFIKDNYNGVIIENDRNLLNGLEVDIYLPDLKLAIEYNGLYWHNELNKHKYYHQQKVNELNKLGIQLIHIYSDEWLYKNDIVKSILLNKLRKSQVIYARNCDIKIVTDKDKKTFLSNNHLQGNVVSKYNIGLYYNNDLVSIMTFGKRKLSNGFEMLRFCNKLNTAVVGGASKLFKHFIKNYKIDEIISYAAKDRSNGKLYEILNFEKIKDTEPNYYYIINNIRENRFKYRKSELRKRNWLQDNETEKDCMFRLGNYRIYDSGSIKYIFTNKQRL